MTAFFIAFLTCAFASLVGREPILVARLSERLGQGPGLLALIWVCSALSAATAAWAAQTIAPMLVPAAKQIFVAAALGLAGLDTLLRRQRRLPVEPTRSLGAIGAVLLFGQLTGSASFLILALTVLTGGPYLPFLGGTLGSAGILTLAWLAGEYWEKRLPLRVFQYVAGGLFLLAGIVVLLLAKGLLA
ncbi:hypothetical protein GRI39_00120 [Altererythrobacter indicus]|uniref:GDT1 family protein n=1 Tax=Altericroceibacterium indicum TaxID=374177 RepID=A0A845A6P5_9SPHN|nr:TMEM165/GDT1 family protein [Altericroceibacterium indicum]MXP24455.1 hypothetical protein [Altericroceibacterium indicum]